MTKSHRYLTAQAFRAALEDRLRSAAVGKSESWLIHQRRFMVVDRLLARLLIVAPDRWVLKGAVALEFRLGQLARATMDLDLTRDDGEEAATDDLLAAQSVDLGDYFTFQIERMRELPVAQEGAIRYRIRADLDGRRFETITLDVGFGDALGSAPDTLTGPGLFGFAGIPPIEVPAIPLAQHVAEKLHAYTRNYGERENTRVKDLVDLVLIAAYASFDAGLLRHAIERTFEARATQQAPATFPIPPRGWDAPYRRIAADTDLDPDLSQAHGIAAAFLDPILDGTVTGAARWDPARGRWVPSAGEDAPR